MSASHIIYNASPEKPIYGEIEGICRITGLPGKGLFFKDWVKDTFTDLPLVYPGEIVCNEALFCFDEASELLQRMSERDKLQRFRTYSHIVSNGSWSIFLKNQKQEMFRLITEESCEVVAIAESGQKHIVFKNKPGMWQLEELQVYPDVEKLKHLHQNMMSLYELGFTQDEIIKGNYPQNKVFKIGLKKLMPFEKELTRERGSSFFTFSSFFMYNNKADGTTTD